MRRTAFLLCTGFLVVSGVASAQQTTPTATAVTSTPAIAASVTASVLTLTRMEICSTVNNRKPMGVSDHFPESQEKVYCFLEFGGAAQETSVDVVWTHGQMEMGRVKLPVRRFPLFRTWANKTISGMKGEWRVDVLDDKGALLKTASFTVQ